MEVTDKLKFNSFSVGEIKNKCLIFFHGWSGDMDSFIPFAKSSKINNAEWFFPQAPYAIENGYSWSYEISKGVWERDEPFFMIRDFLDSQKDLKTLNLYSNSLMVRMYSPLKAMLDILILHQGRKQFLLKKFVKTQGQQIL